MDKLGVTIKSIEVTELICRRIIFYCRFSTMVTDKSMIDEMKTANSDTKSEPGE